MAARTRTCRLRRRGEGRRQIRRPRSSSKRWTTRRPLAWLALMPLTGRTHQLRAHCAAIGVPIAGDGKYGIEPARGHGENSEASSCSTRASLCASAIKGGAVERHGAAAPAHGESMGPVRFRQRRQPRSIQGRATAETAQRAAARQEHQGRTARQEKGSALGGSHGQEHEKPAMPERPHFIRHVEGDRTARTVPSPAHKEPMVRPAPYSMVFEIRRLSASVMTRSCPVGARRNRTPSATKRK